MIVGVKRTAIALLACALTAVSCAAQPASTFTARVVAVLDGDSMRILRDGREVEVRLHGVDAPEGGQAFGEASREFLSTLVRGRLVSVDVRDVDQYGRLVARVSVGGVDVGLDVIRTGHGWHYTRYSGDAAYAQAERQSRQSQRGLWADAAPIAPWDFRDEHGRRPGGSAARGGPAGEPQRAVTGPFHGNVKSRVFHAPGCEHYRCEACTAGFATAEAAIAAGYRPHQECVKR